MTDPNPLNLPPTQYLVMEVLAARRRLGHIDWTFPSHLAPRLAQLERKGLIGWKHGAEHTALAWLTEKGRREWLLPGYVAPARPAGRQSYSLHWSEEDGEWVATCPAYPSLSWLALTPPEALTGLMRLIAEVEAQGD
jgi:hypothetical protein